MRGQKAQDTGQEGAGPDERFRGWCRVGVVGAPDRVHLGACLALGHLKALFLVQADGYIIILCHKG